MKQFSAVASFLVVSILARASFGVPALRLPFTGGEKWTVTQGNNNGPCEGCTHYGNLRYAWDFSRPISSGENCNNDLGAPVLAPAAGTVVYVAYDDAYNGGWGNTVIINYGDGSYGKLSHLDSVAVTIDDYVLQGQVIGYNGHTGNSGGCAHIHYQTQDGEDPKDASISSTFTDSDVITRELDGVPKVNRSYRSDNILIPPYTYLGTTSCTSYHRIPGTWRYECDNPRTEFTVGESVIVFAAFENLRVDHRFKAVGVRDGVPVSTRTWLSSWNRVGNGWEFAAFWPTLENAAPGSWEFTVFIDTNDMNKDEVDDFVRVGTHRFKVLPGGPDFVYAGAVSCTSIDGGEHTGWVYRCVDTPRTLFQIGDNVIVLAEFRQLKRDHRFQVVAYRNGDHQWDWHTAWNDVGLTPWQYAFFWPTLSNAPPGQWTFYIQIELDDGLGWREVGSHTFKVEGTPYTYGGLQTCESVEGGSHTNWVYSCVNQDNTFGWRSAPMVFAPLTDVWYNHHFKAQAFRDGATTHSFEWVTDWNIVDTWGWQRSYFWATMPLDAAPGNWRVKLWIQLQIGQTAGQWQYLGDVAFTMKPYTYLGMQFCSPGELTGPDSNWRWRCTNPRTTFSASETIQGLAGFINLPWDHRFRMLLYKKILGLWVMQQEEITEWNRVGPYGWSYSAFMPRFEGLVKGTWRVRVYIDTGQGFERMEDPHTFFVQ